MKYKYREKGKWKDIEEQIEEDLCREEYAENENFQDVCSVFDEFKIKKYQNDVKQVPAFVYRRLIDFPDVHSFDTDCITTVTFCQGNYKYIYFGSETSWFWFLLRCERSKTYSLWYKRFLYWWVNLSGLNFSNVKSQVRYRDTLKYSQ